jgi:hypothetical protein
MFVYRLDKANKIVYGYKVKYEDLELFCSNNIFTCQNILLYWFFYTIHGVLKYKLGFQKFLELFLFNFYRTF